MLLTGQPQSGALLIIGSEKMSEINTWKVRGSKKEYVFILFLCLSFIVALRAKDMFCMVGSVLLICAKLYSRTKYYIKITDLGIEYFMSLKPKKAKWSEIIGCFNSDLVVILNITNKKPIIINKASVRDSEKFLNLLNEKLATFLQYKCMRCGSQLVSEEIKCQNCGWTIENEQKGISI